MSQKQSGPYRLYPCNLLDTSLSHRQSPRHKSDSVSCFDVLGETAGWAFLTPWLLLTPINTKPWASSNMFQHVPTTSKSQDQGIPQLCGSWLLLSAALALGSLGDLRMRPGRALVVVVGIPQTFGLGQRPSLAQRSGPEVRARHPVDESTPQQLHKMFGYVNNNSHPLKQRSTP